jgi:hypothetical protein
LRSEQRQADLAEIADWTRIAGPDDDQSGSQVVHALVNRVMAETNWQPWPLDAAGRLSAAAVALEGMAPAKRAVVQPAGQTQVAAAKPGTGGRHRSGPKHER